MKTERKTIEQVIFEEEDLKKLDLRYHARLGDGLVILNMGGQFYVCQVTDKKEYQVLGSYHNDSIKPEKLRDGGVL